MCRTQGVYSLFGLALEPAALPSPRGPGLLAGAPRQSPGAVGRGGEKDQVYAALLPIRTEKKWDPKIVIPGELPTPQGAGEKLSTSSWGLWRWLLPHHLPDSIAGATQSKDSQQCSHNPSQWTPGLCLQLPSYLHLGVYRGSS